jgi:hypothetical protein
MAKIKLDHTGLDTAAFIVRMRAISAALAAAPAFAALAPKLPPFDALVDTLEEKNDGVATAKQALAQATTELDTARDAVESSARALAMSSEGETSDDASLQAGGWHLRGAAAPVGPMPAPQNVTCSGGDQDGEVDCTFDPVAGRNSYVGEHAVNPNGPWTQFYVGKKSSCTAKNLTSGTLYWFRFAAVGTAGQGPWSDPASKRAT